MFFLINKQGAAFWLACYVCVPELDRYERPATRVPHLYAHTCTITKKRSTLKFVCQLFYHRKLQMSLIINENIRSVSLVSYILLPKKKWAHDAGNLSVTLWVCFSALFGLLDASITKRPKLLLFGFWCDINT